MLLKRKKREKVHTHTISQQRIFNAIKNTQKNCIFKEKSWG